MIKKITIALVDDHKLFREGISHLLQSIGYDMFGKYKNGKDFISAINPENLPDFVFTVFDMTEIDGCELTKWLSKIYHKINVLALCMNEEERTIQQILENGAKGFIFKDAEPDEFRLAIESTIKKGFYKPNRNNPFYYQKR